MASDFKLSQHYGTLRELFAQEKILSRAGLEPPPVTKLLRTLGLDSTALTLDEAEKIILQAFKRDKSIGRR